MLPQTNPSADLLADDLATVVLAQPPDFSNFKIRVSSEIKRKIDQDHHDLDEGGSNDSKMARDSFWSHSHFRWWYVTIFSSLF